MIAGLQDAFIEAVERAGRSTASIATLATPFVPPFGRLPRRGIGSGVVLDAEGHILTNKHVVDGAERIVVTLADGRIVGGVVLGSDEETDLTVVRVEAGDLEPAATGDSDRLKVGQPVLAIGNPLGLSGGPAVTSGVVSSLRRSLRVGNGGGVQMIQTDAAVNPGNSGGPLVDLEGKVVAITTAAMPYADGVGFAIPINTALRVARELLDHGRVRRPWLGISGQDVDRRLANQFGLAVNRGTLVVEVNPGSPAYEVGLRVGDVLLALDGEPLGGVGDLVERLRAAGVGQHVEMEVDRHGERLSLRATLGTRPF